MGLWVAVCAVDDIDPEDVIEVAHDGNAYAIYRSPDDQFYATDAYCTHEAMSLADGLVIDNIIECPKHNGRFDYRTGEPKCPPVIDRLRTYPTRVENGGILIELSSSASES